MKTLILLVPLLILSQGCAVLRLVGIMDTPPEPAKTVVYNAPEIVHQADPMATPTPTPTAGEVNSRPKKKILVVKFYNHSGLGGKELGEQAALAVKDKVNSFAEYTFQGEDELEDHEPFYSAGGKMDYKRLFEMARAQGASAVITGVIESVEIKGRGDEVGLFRTKYQTVTATVKFMLHDCGNEKLLFSKAAQAEVTEEHTRFLSSKTEEDYEADRGKGAVEKALDKIFPAFAAHARKIAWVGRIAKIDLHRYYINAGENSGIQKGQLLKVFGSGREIFDEESGSSLGVAPGRFKGILKVVEFFGNDGSVAVMHSGAGFLERDRVEVYTPPTQ